jgi:[ribosomal protein S5]-alanine N-acetyltransferase
LVVAIQAIEFFSVNIAKFLLYEQHLGNFYCLYTKYIKFFHRDSLLKAGCSRSVSSPFLDKLELVNNIVNMQIESKRLLLVPISPAYREVIFQEFTAEVTDYTYVIPSSDIAQTDQFISQSIQELKNGTNLELVILLKETKEFIGCMGLHAIKTNTPELGIWTKKSAHGNYYGREAISALKEWAEQNLDYEYLRYPVDKRNIPSQKIPEYLGGKIAVEYEKTNLGGKSLHLVEYRLYKTIKATSNIES